jgi:hypothetical protein
MGQKPKRKAHEDMYKYLKDWNRCAIGLRVAYIFFVILSIISSVIVSSKFSSLEPIVVEILAMTAAISIGLLSAEGCESICISQTNSPIFMFRNMLGEAGIGRSPALL